MASRRLSNSSALVDRIIVRRAADPKSLALQVQQQLNPFSVSEPTPPHRLLASWAESIAPQLIDDARRLLSIESDANSIIERAWQRESAVGQGESVEAIETARILLAALDDSPIQTVRRGIQSLRDRGYNDIEVFQRLSLITGETPRPILLVIPDRMDAWLETIRFLISAVESAINARLILVIDPPGWGRLCELLDSHSMAILAHGLSDADSPPKPVLRYAEEPNPAPSDPALRRTSEPASVQLFSNLQQEANRAVRIAQAIPAPSDSTPDAYTKARSLAEALLYAALQANPTTRDLFALNADGGFHFGSRRAEIDLFCLTLRIAIEVDGYFHFQDNNAYRRDRAKDFLMQAEGFLVLRFLAEDVVDRLETILADILKAVRHRQKPGQ